MAAMAPENLHQTLGWAESALAQWPPLDSTACDSSAEVRALAEVLTLRAHALREAGTSESLKQAVQAYDDALAAWGRLSQPLTPPELNKTASLWMKRGIGLLTLGDHESLGEALPCFDTAIELRSQLLLDATPWYRWGLTAGWMNRGDVLTRLGGTKNLEEAVRSYDLGIAHLHVLPLDAKPEFRWRLALGWMNRGISLQAMETEAARQDALRSFDTSIAVMRGHEGSPRSDYQRCLAAAWANRANVLLGLESAGLNDACKAARTAIQRSRATEAGDALMAESGIKARHALCRALAQLLETPPVDAAQADGWIEEATDAVEDSLSLARSWERRGHADFRPLLEELFHFGARIYRAFQPHFLADFLLDSITPAEQNVSVTEPMHAAAQEAITHAAMQIQSEGLAGLNPAKLDRLLETLADLKGAGETLAALRSRPALD